MFALPSPMASVCVRAHFPAAPLPPLPPRLPFILFLRPAMSSVNMRFCTCLLLAVQLARSASAAQNKTIEWEWAGVFAVADAAHTWSMQKVDGKYADATMRLVIVPTEAPTKETLEATEDQGKKMIAGTCKVIKNGETMKPDKAGSCFDLQVGTGDDTTFAMDTSGLKGVVFFAQHVPTEFERDAHYFYDSKKTNIEPVAQEGASGHHHGHGSTHGTGTVPCQCAAGAQGWKVDCSSKKPMEVSHVLHTAGCTASTLQVASVNAPRSLR